MDQSVDMLLWGRERKGASALAAVAGGMTALPFQAGQFDGALAILSLDFVPNRAAALKEFGRVIKPGGFLLLAVLNRHSLWTLKRRIKSWFGPSRWRQVNFFTRRQLGELMKGSGLFQVVGFTSAVYAPPWSRCGLVRLAPRLERLGARYWRAAAAFLAVLARKS